MAIFCICNICFAWNKNLGCVAIDHLIVTELKPQFKLFICCLLMFLDLEVFFFLSRVINIFSFRIACHLGNLGSCLGLVFHVAVSCILIYNHNVESTLTEYYYILNHKSEMAITERYTLLMLGQILPKRGFWFLILEIGCLHGAVSFFISLDVCPWLFRHFCDRLRLIITFFKFITSL